MVPQSLRPRLQAGGRHDTRTDTEEVVALGTGPSSGILSSQKSNQKSSQKSSQKNGRVTEKVTEKVTVKVTENQKVILKEIEKNAFVSAQYLSEILGISLRKTKENLSKLKSYNLIRRIGPDKGGHWEVVEK